MKIYRLHFTRQIGVREFTFGIWTCSIDRALDFIHRYENETITVEIH